MSGQEHLPHYTVSVIQVKYGKKLTIIQFGNSDGSLDAVKLKNITRELKRRLGAGGTVKNGVIEIQGDHKSRVKIIDSVIRKYIDM